MTSRLTTSAVSPICSRETSSVPLKLMRLYSALRIEASIFVQASKRPSRLPNLHSGGRIKLKDMPKQQSIQNFFGNGSQKRPSDTQPVASLSNKRATLEKEQNSLATEAEGHQQSEQTAAQLSLGQALPASKVAAGQSKFARTATTASANASQAPTEHRKLKLQDLLMEEGWCTALEAEFKKHYFHRLDTFLQSEWEQHSVFPAQEHIFRAMNSCPIDSVRVVILGQDPYHNVGQAMGLSFSVPRGHPVPSSLNNIYRELRTDCGCMPPKHGDLQEWANQGVLLLNTALTVRAHTAASHAKKGWEDFTDAAIRAMSKQREGLVFLLWGKHAQVKATKGIIDAKRHHVLQCAHPSGLSANKGFFGSKHFSQANDLLVKQGMPAINWQISS